MSGSVIYNNCENLRVQMSGIVAEFEEEQTESSLMDLRRDAEAICMFLDNLHHYFYTYSKDQTLTRSVVRRRFGLPKIRAKEARKRLLKLGFRTEDPHTYVTGWHQRECRRILELGHQYFLWDTWYQAEGGGFKPRGLWPEMVNDLATLETEMGLPHLVHNFSRDAANIFLDSLSRKREYFKDECNKFLQSIEPKVFKQKDTRQPA